MVGFEGHATGSTDFKVQLTRMLSAEPDVLYVSDYYNDVAIIAKQARALGFMGPIVGGDGWDSPKYAQLGGTATENTYFTNHFAVDDPHPAVQAFVEAFASEFGGEQADALSALAYDSTNLMLDAVRRAGSADGRAIRDALQSTDASTVCGQVRFDGDRNPVKPAVILMIHEGRQGYFTRIDP